MKCVMCAMARHENAYINDWIKYHLSLGFEEFYIYDNNEPDFELLENCIDENLKDRVHIIDVRGKENYHIAAFEDFYKEYKNEFDWCGLLDIDEFFNLGNFNSIQEFLESNKTFKNVDCILFNWAVYGDDEIIEGDISKPVYERFNTVIYNAPQKNYVKSIIRGKLEEDLRFSPPMFNHLPSNLDQTKYCNVNGKVFKPGSYETINALLDYDICVNHYITKSLKEFIDNKLFRPNSITSFGVSCPDFNYYFRVNKSTPEKIKFINEYFYNSSRSHK